MPTTRASFVALLKPLLPKGWSLSPQRHPKDALAKPTVVVSRLLRVKPTPEAPKGARSSEFIVTLIEPDPDTDQGGDRLEQAVESLLNAIERVPNVSHDGANSVAWNNETPNAYDLPITVITPKE